MADGWLNLGDSTLLAVLLCAFLTIFLKTAPTTLLKGDDIPALARRWLDFVPVAVMAALVGPDIFIYGGGFNISTSNLFLLVSIPVLIIAWIWKNYFVTIAAGIGLVIILRYFGFS